MRIPYLRQLPRALLILSLVVGTSAMAAKGGNGGGGKPGDGPAECAADPAPLFPAFAYPSDIGLDFVSSDGCTVVSVPIPIPVDADLIDQVLTYDEIENFGYYAWLTVDWNTGENTISRQYFSVQDESLNSVGETEILYWYLPESPQDFAGGVQWFDLREDLLAGVEVDVYGNDNELFVIDVANCTALPCGKSDRVLVYSPSTNCLDDFAILGCFKPEARHEAISLDQNSIYFGMTGEGINGGYVYAIGRVTRQDGAWVSQTPELFIREDLYPAIREPSLSKDGRYLSVGYLQPQVSARILIFDLQATGSACPCLAGLSQDFPGVRASWTETDTLIYTGTEGKGRKLRHPVEEINPATGDIRSLGVVFEAFVTVDSSL